VHVRVCRDCGEEYRPEIAVCADCGGALQDRWGDEDTPVTGPRPPGPAAPEAPDLSGFRPVFVTSQATVLVPLAECLREAQIEFVLHESGKGPRAPAASFSLLVHDEDAGRALRELAPLLAGAQESGRFHTVETAFEAGAYRNCPACGVELPAVTDECPACGLGLGEVAAACARCGAPLGAGETECAACGRVEG
jgi:RNA polymerase subunit RPABC4/transcription elongation factor Spt4